MKTVLLEEVRTGMRVVISQSDGSSTEAMTVKGVEREDAQGWQEVIRLFLSGREGQKHIVVAGVEDFSRSGSQILLAT